MEKAALSHGDTISDWRQEKKSGRTLLRPELDRLRQDVRAGRIAAKKVKKTELLDWTIVARVKPGRVDFVKVAKDPSRNGTFEESVIQTVRGKALPKPRDGSPRGIIRDDTGQRALAAFRQAVREAKAS